MELVSSDSQDILNHVFSGFSVEQVHQMETKVRGVRVGGTITRDVKLREENWHVNFHS